MIELLVFESAKRRLTSKFDLSKRYNYRSIQFPLYTGLSSKIGGLVSSLYGYTGGKAFMTK